MHRLIYIFTWILVSGALQAMSDQTHLLTGTVPSIEGKEIDLGSYTGKVVMVVNVASQCGYTKQYAQLQDIYAKYETRGFVVLGFPCNQFGQQEPAPESEILEFCQSRYSVSFPMFSKTDVNGEQAAPLFKALTSPDAPVSDPGPVKWNFEKFLLNRRGHMIGRYRSAVSPDAEEVVAAIEDALGNDSE